MAVLRRIRARVAAPWLLAGCLAFAGAVGAGCGEVDGANQPFAGTTLYTSPSGDYELRLVEPPWLPLVLSGVPVFIVLPNDTPPTSGQLQEADALYSLHVTPVPGDPMAALLAASAGHAPPWNLTQKRAVATTSGAAGFELPWQEGTSIYHREVFVAAAGTHTYFMHFTGKQPLGGDDGVTQMILSFTPHATTASGGDP
jgi:hypothetical protein